MSDISKALYDDHARLKRLFGDVKAKPAVVLTILDELKIHTAIEEEIVYPALRDVDAAEVEKAEEDHAEVDELMAEIEEMGSDDPDLLSAVEALRAGFERHIQYEERVIFPMLDSDLKDQSLDMGRMAFAKRQELLQDLPPRRTPLPQGIANSGWGPYKSTRPGVANAGW